MTKQNILPTHFCQSAAQFTKNLLKDLKKNNLQEQFSSIDHICYRVKTLEDYEHWKKRLASCGKLLSEAYINGRPISSFKLDKEIEINSSYKVNIIELPAPKPGKNYSEGFEHIELVSLGPLESIIKKFENINFNLSNFSAKINRDISFQFPSGLIKFHETSLENIIKEEQNLILQNPRKKILIVDFDDTLIHSQNDFLKATYAALCEYSGEQHPYDDFIKKARPTFPDFFANFGIKSSEEIKKVILLFQKKWKELNHATSYCTGIESTLSCLYHEGVKIVIWTARDQETTFDFVKESPLGEIIEHIFSYEGEQNSKPFPQDLLVSLCKNSDAIILGDSLSDQKGAKELGIDFYQAAWVQKASLEIHPDFVCDSPFIFLEKAIQYFK